MTLTLEAFFTQVAAYPSLAVILILVILVAIVSGATDAPNAIATAVSTRCLSPGTALILAAIFNFVGLIGMTYISAAVAETMFSMVNFSGDTNTGLVCLEAGMVSAILWGLICWLLGIPASKSHSLIAGVTGAAVAMNGWAGIVWSEWAKVIYGLIFSLVVGFLLGYFVTKAVQALFNTLNRSKANKVCAAIQDVFACVLAFLHGGQDGQKFMSIALLGIALSLGMSDASDLAFPVWLRVVVSTAISLGTLIGGKRIIKSVAMDMVKLEKYQGVTAQVSTSVLLLVANLTGMPVSTSHCSTSSIMGVGASKNIKGVRWNMAGNMVTAWLITFPLCGLLGFLMANLFMLF